MLCDQKYSNVNLLVPHVCSEQVCVKVLSSLGRKRGRELWVGLPYCCGRPCFSQLSRPFSTILWSSGHLCVLWKRLKSAPPLRNSAKLDGPANPPALASTEALG